MAFFRNTLLLVGSLLLLGPDFTAAKSYSKDGDLDIKLLELLLDELVEDDKPLNFGKRQSTCTSEYQELGKRAKTTQTMCKHANPAATNTGVSAADQQKIMDFHNRIRSEVQPPAGDMQKMYWNDELAKIAQHYAETCPKWHDQAKERYSPEYGTQIWVGQNIAQGQPDWHYVLMGWYNETKYYTYGREYSGLSSNGKAIGHYTQQIWATTALIGCGYADCPGVMPYSQYTDNNMFACNYIWGQSYDVSHPYRSASRMGDECPNSRTSKGLCDCNGLVCKNGGTVDVSTCSCQCPKLKGGNDCGKVVCPEEDLPSCHMYEQRRCTEWTNVPEECPYKCGVCKPGDYQAEDVTTTTAAPPPTKAPTEPPATPSSGGKPGGQPDKKPGGQEGQKPGDQGHQGHAHLNEINTGPNACAHVDPPPCRGITHEACQQKKYQKKCPNGCKQCEERCPGKTTSTTCFNEGYLKDDCSCECSPDWGGDRCEVFQNCPSVDFHECNSHLVRDNNLISAHCGRSTVWPRCPIMCGVCPVVCPHHSPDDCIHGVMESDCQCHCEAGFTGPDCYMYVQCPVEEDDDSCAEYADHLNDDNKCIDGEIREKCPYMCGTCTKDKRHLRNLMRRSHIV